MYSVLVILFVLLGSTLHVDLVWNMSDMFNGLMVLPNLIALLAGAGIVYSLHKDYQKKQNELLAPIIDKAKSAIDKVAAAGGFLVVFDTSTGSLAYFDEATLTDVAPAVKKELGITDAPAAAPAAK